MQNNLRDVWGFNRISLGSPADPAVSVKAVVEALAVGAQDRGIDSSRPSDALDTSRDVIIDDVIFGVIGGLPRGTDWKIDNDTLYAVWGGMTLETLIAQ